jgi:S-disulfanyl-L-cysteine oxidoreductase SoxD
MSSRNARLLAVTTVAAMLGGIQAAAQQGPGLGQPISDADLAPWDISIQPSGAGLPAGSGTAAKGAEIYAVKCIACHGEKGAGQPNDRLVGGQGTLTELAQVRTIGSFWPKATTVFDYIRRAMPFQAPESLTNDEVYALTAYLLALNGIIKEGDEMNARALARVQMPNRNGFVVMYPERTQR